MAEVTITFAPGQVWSLRAPAPASMRVRIGAVHEVAGKAGVHVEIAHAPLPEGFETEGGATTISLGHVPIAAFALANAVDALEDTNAVLSDPFIMGFEAWKKEWDLGRAGFFDVSPLDAVKVIFEAYKRAKA
ncbi:MAG: hypothetical protein ACOYKM_04485 [Caulobacterales bacterium]